MAPRLACAITLGTAFLLGGGQATASGYWLRAADAHGVDPRLLYAIGLQESRTETQDGSIEPWPWTLNDPHYGPRRFQSRCAAAQALQNYLKLHPESNIDIGMMQISWRWHGDRVEDPLQLLDPETSVHLAAKILAEAMDSTSSRLTGVGRYHSYTSYRALSYGAEVWRTYFQLPPTRELFENG